MFAFLIFAMSVWTALEFFLSCLPIKLYIFKACNPFLIQLCVLYVQHRAGLTLDI